MSNCCGRIITAGRSAPAAALTRRHVAGALGSFGGGSGTPRQQRRVICGVGSAPASEADVSADLLSFRTSGFDTNATGRYGRAQRWMFSTKAGAEDPDEAKEAAKEERPGVLPGAFEQVDFEVYSGGADEGDDENDGSGGDPGVGGDGIDRSKYTHEVKFRMPELGEVGEEDGVVVKWYKKEGDIIRRKDILCDVKTELFEFGMESDDEKVTLMGKILVSEGSDPVEPGEVLCVILHEETEKGKEHSQE